MEESHRKIIDTYCDEIIPKINMHELFPKLLEHKVYNEDDVNISKWKKENLNVPYVIKDIILKIKTRGPKAFQHLLLSLKQIGNKDIADMLEEGLEGNNGKVKQKNNKHNNKMTYDDNKNDSVQYDREEENPFSIYQKIIQSNEPLKIKLRKATELLDNYKSSDIILPYPMQSNPRGLVLLITNIDYISSREKSRPSAEHDKNNLKELFEQMGFTVISKQNCTGRDIKDAVREFSRRSDLNKVDSCFVIISSHGTEDEEHHTEIRGVDSGRSDAEKILCSDILDFFTVDACPQMAEKPKVFIFQICRGSRTQNAVRHERFVTDTCGYFPEESMDEELKSDNIIFSDKNSTRNYADMLIVHSTLPGHVAYRDSKTGSWFIQILCDVFMNLAYRVHVRDLFSIIDSALQHLRAINDNCQTSSVKSIGFNRPCYLNPGYFPN